MPDGWMHRREHIPIGAAVTGFDHALFVGDVPAEAALLRQLMHAVRDPVAETNAAEPSEESEDQSCGRSLNGVLEEVFKDGSGERPAGG